MKSKMRTTKPTLAASLTLCGKTYNGIIVRENYSTSGMAALIFDERDAFVCTLTLNPPERINAGVNDTVIKDYSENTGVLAQLIEKGIVRETGKKIFSGFIEASVVEIIAPDLMEE